MAKDLDINKLQSALVTAVTSVFSQMGKTEASTDGGSTSGMSGVGRGTREGSSRKRLL